MAIDRFVSEQLHNPSTLIGRLVLGRLWNRRNKALNDAAYAALELQPGDRVLEVGFGGGYLLGRMLEAVKDGCVAGVDASAAMVAFCLRRYRPHTRAGRLELKLGRAERLPYASESFGKACSVNSIFYWQDARQALSELRRVLAPGGRLALCFTAKASLEKRGFAQHDVHAYETVEVQEMLAACAFHDVRAQPGEDRHRRFVCLMAVK